MISSALIVLGTVAGVTAAHGGETAQDPLQFGPLKIGFDGLVRGDATDRFNLPDSSFSPDEEDRRVLFRIRPSLTYAPVDYLTARVEGQWYAAYNDDSFSQAALYQGYLEGSLPESKMLVLRAGRQELVYGSAFMLGADTFFDGLTFDAAKFSIQSAKGVSADFFAGKYVKKNSGDIEGELYGAYVSYSPAEDVVVELYGMLDTGDAGLTHKAAEHERTYSVGARFNGKLGKSLTLEVEPVFQLGRKLVEGASHDAIRAFGGHVDLTIDSALGRYPTLVYLSYAYGSGDGEPQDGKFREFHNPNNDTALVGDVSVVGDLSGLTAGDYTASGLQVLALGTALDVTDKLNVSLDGHYFRANEVPAGFSKELGIEFNLIVTYEFRDNVSIVASGNRFFTGSFFEDASGRDQDVNYWYVQIQAVL